jgi:hypothetical protein
MAIVCLLGALVPAPGSAQWASLPPHQALLGPLDGLSPDVARGTGSAADTTSSVYLPLLLRQVKYNLYLPLIAVRYSGPRPVFGVQMYTVGASEGLAQAVSAGARWVRSPAFAWDLIEPVRTSPPTYLWNVVDETSLVNAAANGMAMIGIVNFSPAWAQEVPGLPCGRIRQDQLAAFGEFLGALVSRYGQRPFSVRYWELWNEPDVDPGLVGPRAGYGCWGDAADPYFGGGYYAEMLKVAYPVMKAADPQAQVLLGGLLLDCDPRTPPPHKSCESARYLEGILLNGGGPLFDAVSFHAYTWYGGVRGAMGNPNWPGSITAMPEKATFIREVLGQYGFGDKPLISTEAALLFVNDNADTRETQAAYVPRVFAEALALGLTAQIKYKMTNDEYRQDQWRNVGLLEGDLDPKPAYFAYDTASSFLSAARYIGPAIGYPGGVEGYTFDPPGSSLFLDVIWSVDGTPQTVPLPEGSEAYDRYGVLIGSTGSITVDYGPVYVQRP